MRTLKGTIISAPASHTVTVRVDRLRLHPKYQKYVRISKKFKAHCGSGDYRKSDEVMMGETRPLSREKRWKILELVRRPESKEMETV